MFERGKLQTRVVYILKMHRYQLNPEVSLLIICWIILNKICQSKAEWTSTFGLGLLLGSLYYVGVRIGVFKDYLLTYKMLEQENRSSYPTLHTFKAMKK